MGQISISFSRFQALRAIPRCTLTSASSLSSDVATDACIGALRGAAGAARNTGGLASRHVLSWFRVAIAAAVATPSAASVCDARLLEGENAVGSAAGVVSARDIAFSRGIRAHMLRRIMSIRSLTHDSSVTSSYQASRMEQLNFFSMDFNVSDRLNTTRLPPVMLYSSSSA